MKFHRAFRDIQIPGHFRVGLSCKDHLGLPIAFADSQAGILRFMHGTGAGEMELTAILRNVEEVTRIEIIGADGELPGVLLDESSSTLHQSFESVTRRTTARKRE